MIDSRGLDIVCTFEGLKLRAYLCPANVWTIGYGSTHWFDGRPVVSTDVLKDADEAVRLMNAELVPTEMFVRRVAKLATEAQIAALTSFAYNVGKTAWKGSTLLQKHNRGDYEGAAAQFLRWNKGGGRVLAGLTRRRAAESALYLEG